MTTAASVPPPSRPRRVAFIVLTALPALAILAFGGQLLIAGWFSTTAGGSYRFAELSWGVAEGLVILVGLVASLRSAHRRPAAYQQVLGGCLALVTTMVLTRSPDSAVLVIIALLGVAAWLHPARSELVAASWHAPTLVLAAVLAVPLGWHALEQARLHRSGSATDPHIELLHYVGTALAAIAIVVTVVVAAARGRGYRIPAYTAALGLAVLGVASLLFPDATSAWPTPWAIASLLGGVAVVAVANVGSARSTAADGGRRPQPAPF